MKTVWTKGLESDAKDEIQVLFTSGARLRKRLSVIVAEKMDAKDRESMASTEYENPNWPFKQADAQGYRRALKEILSILE